MTKTILAIALATAALAGQAMAADAPKANGFRIESEDQFARDYADRIERIDAGVYLVTKGPLAGRTVAMGEAGLAYNLAALRAQTPRTFRERVQLKSLIRRLEGTRARYAKLRSLQERSITKASQSGSLPCVHHNPRTGATTWYSATAFVDATAEYYMSNGGGGLNYYYARASAGASGYVPYTYGVPFGSGVTSIYAVAWNHNTNVLVQSANYGSNPSVYTGYVYSGPDFSHNLEAFSGVEGEGDCFGMVSISATLP